MSVEIVLWLGTDWVFELRGWFSLLASLSSMVIVSIYQGLSLPEEGTQTHTHIHTHGPWKLQSFLPWRPLHVIIGFLYEASSAETSQTRKWTKMAAAGGLCLSMASLYQKMSRLRCLHAYFILAGPWGGRLPKVAMSHFYVSVISMIWQWQ